MKKNIDMDIFEQIKKSGGTAYIVGGYARDYLLNLKNEDIDIEVYGLSQDKLNKVLKTFGKVNNVGKSFGVTVVNINNVKYDFSIPRKDTKNGNKHTDFDVFIDPNMSTLEASNRRDLTINSIMYNPLTDKFTDHNNGIRDLKNGTIRYVSERFSEDPLRALRAMKFSARLNFIADDETISMCKGIKNEYSQISKERIWKEWEDLAFSKFPQNGIDFLDRTGWIEHYPDINNLKGCIQDKTWHPEGDVFTHTKLCLEQSARVSDERNYSDKDKLILFFAVLCHDFGKPSTTMKVDGKIRALGHANAGVVPAKRFLKSINAPKWLINNVIPLVDKHIHHAGIKNPTKRNVKRLANSLQPSNIDMWDAVVESDLSGRFPLPLSKLPKEWVSIAKELNIEKDAVKPIINGKDLINLGFKPSKEFSVILDDLYDMQIDGDIEDKDSMIKIAKEKLNYKNPLAMKL